MDTDFTYILDLPHPELAMAQSRPFAELMLRYTCALREIQTKFEALGHECSVLCGRNPVESIKTRLKTPHSIITKLQRRGLPLTLESIRENLNDVAGARVICPFQDDVYRLAELLTRHGAVTLLQVKDYIKTPKPNGYRSLHLIIETPVFLSCAKESVRAEVQLRTVAMDLWANLEYELQYKRTGADTGALREELCACAERVAQLDLSMQTLMRRIEEED